MRKKRKTRKAPQNPSALEKVKAFPSFSLETGSPAFSDVRAQIQAQMFESSQVPRRLETFFADASDDYADAIASDSVRQEMRANSRKVFLTEGCANHGTFTMSVHCLGGSGPQLTMIAEKEAGRSDSDPFAPSISADDRAHIEYEWFRFAQEIDLNEHVRLAVEALQYDGEIFFLLVHDPEITDCQLNLQQVEASRVQSAAAVSDSNIVSGIEFEGLHPAFYHILPKSVNPTLDFHWAAERVPAQFVVHFFVPRLPDQHRGLPWMQSVLTSIAETKLYEEYHLGAANAAARSSGGVVECQSGSQIQGNLQDVKLSPSYSMWNPGEIKQLLPGLTYKQGAANWPSSNYAAYVDAMREKISAGMQTTKAMLTNNFEKHNYSSFRGEMIVYWEMIRFLRKRLEKMLLDRVFEEWLRCMAPVDETIAGLLKKYRFRRKRIPRSWIWEPIPAYDLSDKIAFLADAVEHGFMSRKMAVQALGHDFEQVEQERMEDRFENESQTESRPENPIEGQSQGQTGGRLER